MKSHLPRFLSIGILSLILFMTCNNKTPTEDDLWIGNSYNWPTSSPADQGLDWNILKGAFDEAGNKSYMASLLIVRNGYLVAEEYYNQRSQDTLDRVFSVTKSITSALIGIAIHEGYIDSLDQKMLDFFPEYDPPDMDPRKKEITIRHLLAMQSGFDTEGNIYERVAAALNMILGILSTELQFDPGTDFLYSTHGSHVLSGIITKATGKNTLDYAIEKLFNPIGIKTFYWPKDKNGIPFGGSSLQLTPRDMARFGFLYMKNGFLDGQQIIPAEWIELSVQNHRSYQEPWKEMDDVGYGFQWWTGRFDQYPLYFASGYGGQWIINIPDLNLIIVATMDTSKEYLSHHMASLIPIVYNHVLPSVVD